MPLGNRNPSATTRASAVRHHQNDAAGRAAIGRRRHVEAEIADIGAAQAVDDHVVDRCRPRSPTGRHKAKAGRRRRSSGACDVIVSTTSRPSGRMPVPQGVSSSNVACCSRSPEGRGRAASDPCSRRTRAGRHASAAPRSSVRRQARIAASSATASPRSCRGACWLPCARTPFRSRRTDRPCRSAVAVFAIPPRPRCPSGPRQRSRGLPRWCGCGR